MSHYRRTHAPGGCFFFTVVTRHRRPWLTRDDAIERLRQAFRKVMRSRPFAIDALVVLPDHLHAIWQLPEDDGDYATRWRLVKHHVSTAPGLHGQWQPRYWEHCLRNREDWRRHVSYIHYNPVKHGYAETPSAWPFSSFHQAVKRGWHPPDWGHQPPPDTLVTPEP